MSWWSGMTGGAGGVSAIGSDAVDKVLLRSFSNLSRALGSAFMSVPSAGLLCREETADGTSEAMPQPERSADGPRPQRLCHRPDVRIFQSQTASQMLRPGT